MIFKNVYICGPVDVCECAVIASIGHKGAL